MDPFERLASKPHLDGPKRHHYVPKFYLEGFAESGLLAVYDRKDGLIRPQSPVNTGVKGHFYTFFDEEDRKRFDLEKLFSIIEGRAAPALAALDSRRPITFEDREQLAILIAMSAVRTPAALAEARHVREQVTRLEFKLRVPDKRAALRLARQLRGKESDEPALHRLAEQAFEMISQDGYRVNVPPEMARQMSLKRWEPIAQELLGRDWVVLHAPEGRAEYLTSDSPVVLEPKTNAADELPVGYGSPHAHVLFPLTRRTALVLTGDGSHLMHLDTRPEQVASYNAAVAADCFRYVIGSTEEIVRAVVDPLKLTGTSWAPKIEVGIGDKPNPDGTTSRAIYIKGLARRSSPTAATRD